MNNVRRRSVRFLLMLSLLLGCVGVVGAYAQSTNKAAPVAKPKTKADVKPAKAQPEAKPAEKPVVAAQPDSKSKADARLVKALKAAGYKYEEIEQGVLKLYFETSDGRSQQVFVASQTQKTASLETRKIWATAMKREDPLPAPIANKLLMDTDKVAFGAWELVKWADGYRVLFVTSVPAELPPDDLKTAIRLVFSKADTMEKELTNADKF